MSTKKTQEGRVVAVLNFKGGVGKTTTTVNLAAALAKAGRQVLVVDLDSQCNSSRILRDRQNPPSSDFNIYRYLVEQDPELQRNWTTFATDTKGLDFVPSSAHLQYAEVQLVNRRRREYILSRLTDAARQHYDFILLDCPPGKGIITDNAMTAADGIIVPIECEILSLQGLASILQEVADVKQQLNPRLRILGFLATKYDQRLKMAKQILSSVESSTHEYLFRAKIHRNVALAEFSAQCSNVFDYSPTCVGADDYQQLAREFLRTMKNVPFE